MSSNEKLKQELENKKHENQEKPEETKQEDSSYIEEQKALLKSLEPSKWFRKIWEFLNSPMKTFSWLSFVITTVIMIFVIGISAYVYSINSIHKITDYNKEFNKIEQVKYLRKSYEVFKNSTKEEIVVSWVDLFSHSDYQLNGDPKYNQFDCAGALNAVFNYWGANIPIENVKSIVYRCENLAKRGELDIRKNYYEVQPKDIIIIQTSKNDPSHVGMVWNTNNGYVQYVDVNAKVQTIGFNEYKFNDWHIYRIYEVSYSLWIGDLLKTLNEIK